MKNNFQVTLLASGIFLLLVLPSPSGGKMGKLRRLPIVRIIQNHSLPILIKGISEGGARIAYRPTNDSTNMMLTDWMKLAQSNDYAANVILRSLKNNAHYDYKVDFKAGYSSWWFRLTTFPLENKSGRSSLIFSSCFREKFKAHFIFGDVERFQPTFVALLGDKHVRRLRWRSE